MSGAWLLLGLGMGLGLYDAAFAALGRIYGDSARKAITGITLIAGFASTVGWPLSIAGPGKDRMAGNVLCLGRGAHPDRPPINMFFLEWERRTALIGNEKGQVIFRQENVEVPKAWSQTATNIVASKYFHGKPNTPEREGSVRQLIGRVVDTIVGWGEEGGYFAAPKPRPPSATS